DELRVRLDAVLPRQPLRVGLGRLRGRRLLRGRGRVRERAPPPALRLGELEHEPREREGGQGEDHERGAPGERGDVAGDGKADAGSPELAGEDVAVDPAALRGGEVVAYERGDERAGRRGDAAEEDAREEELAEA